MVYRDRYNEPIGYKGGYFQAITDVKGIIYGENLIINPTDGTFTTRNAQDILKEITEFIKRKEEELDEKL